MTAALHLAPAPLTWELMSTEWDGDVVELEFCADDESSSLVTVRVGIDMPRTASEPAYREELRVLDVEGAPLDALGEVEANRERILREFYSAKSLGRC